MDNIAVVTAVAGRYDHIGSHKGYHKDVDYFFFTNGDSLPADPEWQIRSLPNLDLDNRRLAKFPKLYPHYFKELCDYRYVIWIDGSIQIKKRLFIPELLSHMTDNGLVLSPHFDGRDCGYSEGSIKLRKYDGEPRQEQMAAYRAEGFPEHYGLYECGLHVRDMQNPLIKDFGKCWLDQIIKWSPQDQLSCGYSLWKSGVQPDVLPQNFRNLGWVVVNAHK